MFILGSWVGRLLVLLTVVGALESSRTVENVVKKRDLNSPSEQSFLRRAFHSCRSSSSY